MDMPELKAYENKAFTDNGSNENTRKQETESEKANTFAEQDEECLARLQAIFVGWYSRNRKVLVVLLKMLVLALFFSYFGYAMYYRFGDEGSVRLLVCTCFGVFLLSLYLAYPPLSTKLPGFPSPTRKTRRVLYWILCVSMATFIVVYTGVDVGRRDPRNLVSLSGIAFFILTLTITSKHIRKVRWHTVFWGLALQYVFALVIIRTSWGYDAFDYLGDRVTELMGYSDVGAEFVFGEDNLAAFAFKVLSVVIYFSSVVSILYYLGVMQAFVRYVGRFLAFCMDTSATETINAAGNIFLSQNESPLLIRPFLEKMTKSELHAVLTGGFATVSGSTLGAYISFGVKASYLLGASVMSAPAALAMSKLTYPETEDSNIDNKEVYQTSIGTARNVIEAAAEGSSTAIKICANIAANLIAFLAILAFINATLVWFGDRVGVEGLTFQFLCSYLFYPMAFLMGVDTEDCRRVAQLIGYKTFANEFVAYIEMGKLLDNGEVYQNYTTVFGANATVLHDGLDVILPEWNTTLTGGFLAARSEVITTYALCGFSNLSSMGIMMGMLGSLAPSRKSDIAGLLLRALVAGSVACFMTACIAGLLFEARE